MKLLKPLLVITCLSFLWSFTNNVKSTDWLLRKDKEGIKIFTREASNTNIKEVKTVLMINASVSKITAAIVDVENYSKWMENIMNPKILEKVNENDYYLYYEVEAPWPTDNRDIVNHTVITYDQTNNLTLVTSVTAPDYIEEKENTVRITLSEGSWELKELSENKVEITHRLLVSPGGSIPDWIINMFIVNHPYEMHLNLRKMLE